MWIYKVPHLESDKVNAMMAYARHLGIETKKVEPNDNWAGWVPTFCFGTKDFIEMCHDWFPGATCPHSHGPNGTRLGDLFGKENLLNPDVTLHKAFNIPWPEDGSPLFIITNLARKKNKPMTKFTFDQEMGVNRMVHKYWVAPVKKINAEYRFFVVAGRIITWSQYAKNNEMIISSNVPRHVGMWLAPLVKDTIGYYVVDVADTPEGLRVIETNTLNSSGLYDCDIVKLVTALKEYHDTPDA